MPHRSSRKTALLTTSSRVGKDERVSVMSLLAGLKSHCETFETKAPLKLLDAAWEIE